MKTSISIKIDEKMKSDLVKFALEAKKSEAEIISDALDYYFFKQNMKKSQEKLLPYFEKKGIESEEDLFKTIS